MTNPSIVDVDDAGISCVVPMPCAVRLPQGARAAGQYRCSTYKSMNVWLAIFPRSRLALGSRTVAVSCQEKHSCNFFGFSDFTDFSCFACHLGRKRKWSRALKHTQIPRHGRKSDARRCGIAGIVVLYLFFTCKTCSTRSLPESPVRMQHQMRFNHCFHRASPPPPGHRGSVSDSVAQTVEQWTCYPKFVGSNPTWTTELFQRSGFTV